MGSFAESIFTGPDSSFQLIVAAVLFLQAVPVCLLGLCDLLAKRRRLTSR